MKKSLASKVIDQLMSEDHFSQWLGILRLEESEGFCRLEMAVSKQMCNGFGIAHGGIAYSLADTALAFASNSRGRKAVSLETSISHIKPVSTGEVIVAITDEISISNHIGIYTVRVEKRSGALVALFKGTVYITDQTWSIE